jgi:hypothetical protein
MDNDRLIHSYNVGKKMMEIGKKYNLSEEELEELFILGLNHDIGYEFTEDTTNHNKVGGEILKNQNYKYYKEVYYHGEIQNEYNSLYLDILNMADMQIDKYGNDVGYENRLKDIENRYGIDSYVYKKCFELIKELKEKE